MNAPPVLPVVEAVADAKGVDPNEMEMSLQDHVDTDAIRLLAAHDDATWTLSFELPDHEVTVTSDCVVLVDGARQAAWA
ncbi:HalOD1 output domain-containing protein [Natronomonas marina]|jgi:hypothetical protein|uniref:HalOD1 output domain-containing protein n=1 Tax=Natronomonas marina TaxID=2961939 RepID=UPI0020C9ED4E|nr:HalOD1 output domain-containing protein [Natronomonas marina]